MSTYTYAFWQTECWLKQFSEAECEGRMDPAHLLPKQVLKKAKAEVELYDERLWIPACRLHHATFDNYRLTVPRESLPVDLVSLAEELGLLWYLDRRYGAPVAA